MRFPKTYTLKEIAELIGSRFVGEADFPILGMNEIHVVKEGEIVFVDHPKYYDKALASPASIVLINKEVAPPKGKALLLSDDPFRDFNVLTRYFKPFQQASANIAPSAKIGAGTVVQPNVFIGNNVVIGRNCVIHSNVSLYDGCVLGDHVIIHSGTVLGSDAFYYKKRTNELDKLVSGGRVVVEDHVEIGALCSIDKGVTGDTTIKEGTKLDNQVQIGHDTVIGRRCLIASQTGIAGCVVLEDEVTLWGQVGVVSGITIGAKTVVHAQSGVGKTLPGGKVYFGSPVSEAREKMKEMAFVKRLPELFKKNQSHK